MKISSFFILFVGLRLGAQELNCRIIVNAQQVQTTERAIFTEMETDFAQFLNTTKWTSDSFSQVGQEVGERPA
ncbi:MAG: DUF4835 family protein [Ekhidna sp.]|nr:DUF4835 family protein [Ekhidna sp.]